MRNPDRIDNVLSYLKLYWNQKPDLRLGQIITNLVREYNLEHNSDIPTYYLEDTAILDALHKQIEKTMNITIKA